MDRDRKRHRSGNRDKERDKKRDRSRKRVSDRDRNEGSGRHRNTYLHPTFTSKSKPHKSDPVRLTVPPAKEAQSHNSKIYDSLPLLSREISSPSSMPANFSSLHPTPHDPSPATNSPLRLCSELFALLGCAFRAPRPGGPGTGPSPKDSSKQGCAFRIPRRGSGTGPSPGILRRAFRAPLAVRPRGSGTGPSPKDGVEQRSVLHSFRAGPPRAGPAQVHAAAFSTPPLFVPRVFLTQSKRL